MSTQTIERVGPAPAERIRGKYVSLVSFKRDGTPVATPMWFVVDGDRLLVTTGLQPRPADPRQAAVRRSVRPRDHADRPLRVMTMEAI